MGSGVSPGRDADVPPLSCEAPITVLSLRGGRSRLLVWVAASLLVALIAAVGLSVRGTRSSRFVADRIGSGRECHRLAPAFADTCFRRVHGWRRGLSCLLLIQATQGKDGRLTMLEQILPFENL